MPLTSASAKAKDSILTTPSVINPHPPRTKWYTIIRVCQFEPKPASYQLTPGNVQQLPVRSYPIFRIPSQRRITPNSEIPQPPGNPVSASSNHPSSAEPSIQYVICDVSLRSHTGSDPWSRTPPTAGLYDPHGSSGGPTTGVLRPIIPAIGAGLLQSPVAPGPPSNQRPGAPSTPTDHIPPIQEGSVTMASSTAIPATVPSSAPVTSPSTQSNSNQKLSFDKLTEAVRTNTQHFDDWQQSVIRCTMINSDTRSAVDPTTLTFMSAMNSFQSLKIYDALATSIIPNLPSTCISATQKKNNNAPALFAALLKIYGTEARTVVKSLKAQKAFTDISKDTTTTMDKYFTQFKESLTHSQLTMSQQELAVHYFTSLDHVALADIIFAISEN